MQLKALFTFCIALMMVIHVFAQDVSPFDFGKMWTFENPPKEWFKQEYAFDATDAWFEDVRMASLRFASWCSASFVSPNGLIMTNHHCSRDVVVDLQRDGENFDENGFYARTLEDERKAEGLFVEQLHKVMDITDLVEARAQNAENSADRMQQVEQALTEIIDEFSSRPEWEDLRLQPVVYYSGGKYSLYGYKRYDDIRLVLIPELDLGYFGGDPDNFTYPRYSLDCTFWRAYDDSGNPLDTRDFYFKFNPDGIHEGTPVFVIGNPGNTERYRTVAQLEYDRDYRYPVQLEFLKNRYAILEKKYEEDPSDGLKNQLFSLSNSIKAYTGIVDGLNDPELFARKVKMEQVIRRNAEGKDYWDRMEGHYENISDQVAEVSFLSPNPMLGKTIGLIHTIDQFKQVAEVDWENPDLDNMREQMVSLAPALNTEEERMYLATVLGELKKFQDPGDNYIDVILDGRTPEVAAKEILDETVFSNPKKLEKILEKKKAKKFLNLKDPVKEMSDLMAPLYHEALIQFQSSSAERGDLEQKVANAVYQYYGSALPPDATFTLRISDGKVKRYDYNGTVAPYKTTFYGLYDRYYSNEKAFPWSLPERWENPPAQLLQSPLNFVSTNDIIGGNSGSPVINQNKEAVGLIFDGNIESLPGNFIFDEEFNRSVSVHTGGIIAAMRYIYNADRIVDELLDQ